jgi:hypothetical protein
MSLEKISLLQLEKLLKPVVWGPPGLLRVPTAVVAETANTGSGRADPGKNELVQTKEG